MSFLEKWLEAVDKKNSVVCAGVDPAEFEMGRKDEGLPEGTDKRSWVLKYVEAVSRDCSAIKLNINYFKNPDDMAIMKEAPGGMTIMKEAMELARSLGMVSIDDSKLDDIGATNDAGFYHAAKKGADAVTVAPFAGNLEEMAKQKTARGVGAIVMCLMSNPEYKHEKLKLVTVDPSAYSKEDVIVSEEASSVHQYIKLAHDAKAFGIDGIVIGAPSAKNHIQNSEIAKVRDYVGSDMLVLLPGVGNQGGEAGIIWGYFGIDSVIVNVGRALMFPKGSNSSSEDHIAAAKYYKDMLNSLRAK